MTTINQSPKKLTAMEELAAQPLLAPNDPLKLKELEARFPLGKFMVTDTVLGLYYEVEFDKLSQIWNPAMLWTDKEGYKDRMYYFARPLKLEVVSSLGSKVDLSHHF